MLEVLKRWGLSAMPKPILLAAALLTLAALLSAIEARPAASAQSYCKYRYSLCLARCDRRPPFCLRRCQGQYRACRLGMPYLGDLI
jgi:hypothetical protein